VKYPIEVRVVCSNPESKEKSIGFSKREDDTEIILPYLFDLQWVRAIKKSFLEVNGKYEDAVWVEMYRLADIAFLGDYDEFLTLWKSTCQISESFKF